MPMIARLLKAKGDEGKVVKGNFFKQSTNLQKNKPGVLALLEIDDGR